MTQNGTIINDVELPKWAKSPKDFLKKNRKALESDHCSQYLPHWIDLIFGEKSRGTKAEEAMNVFHPTSYLSPKDVDAMESEEQKSTAELQATEFGICPDMLFCSPHPNKSGNVDDIANTLNLNLDRALDFGLDESNTGEDNGDSKDWELLPSLDAVPFISNSNEEKQRLRAGSNDNKIGLRNSNDEKTDSELLKKESSWITGAQSHEFSDTPQKYQSETTTIAIRNQNSRDDIKLSVSNDKFYSKKIPLSGSGDSNRNSDDNMDVRNGTFGVLSSQSEGKKIGLSILSDNFFDNKHEALKVHKNQEGGWDLELIASMQIHSDIVSGCCISLDQRKSSITSTSLDGSLMVHIIPNSPTEQQNTRRRGFTSQMSGSSRFSYSLSSNNNTATTTRASVPDDNLSNEKSNKQRFHKFRSHTSSDPLACLATVSYYNQNVMKSNTSDGGQIAFAGGHDDVILAYGVNSACGLASVYSHRDAITGLDVVPFCYESHSMVAAGTHLMISGSWDATVKLWNVSISKGENVEISKEPIAELFDAESSVSDVAGVVVDRNIARRISTKGLFIAAGCTDGSLTIWFWTEKGMTYHYPLYYMFLRSSFLKWLYLFKLQKKL